MKSTGVKKFMNFRLGVVRVLVVTELLLILTIARLLDTI